MQISNLLYPVVFTILLFSIPFGCNSDIAFKTEVNKVFAVKKSNDGFVAGDLLYLDSVVYQSEFLPKVKYVFNKEGDEVGHEVYPIALKEGKIQSEYLSASGEKLSYYDYTINSDLKKVKSEAYDASNDELLRYEEMDYDNKGHLYTRKIFTSAGQLATSYSFIYDGYGNEIRKITQHLLRDTIITEESRITKYFDDKSWKEKWGFINDKPIAYYKRTLKVH